ncbi:MAG: cell shape-determining protein MreC [Candidatus Paceibacteria bacterium]|jgi:cell shape-determining protein MreC
MSYRYDKARKTKGRWYFLVAFLVILVIFTPVYSLLFNIIEKPLAYSWQQKGKVFNGTENFFQAFYGKQQILDENEELKQEINRLEIDNLRTRYLSEELEKVFGLLDIDSGLIPARILNKGILGSRDVLIIDQGSENNVAIADSVVAYDNSLIGSVNAVFNNTAHVTLYSHPEQLINGVLFPHNVNVIAQGHGNGGFLIETPREIEAATGDILYSLTEPGNIIAIVREVIFDPRDPFKQVYLSYPRNINEVQVVGIKKSPRSASSIE